MRHHLILMASVLISACAFSTGNTMNLNPLSISIQCKDNPECIFSGENMPIVISVKNDGPSDIELPIAFMQKTGPSIKLINNKNNRSVFLKKNLAPPELRKNLTKLAPNKSILIDWVLINSELQQFGNESIDLTAEVTIQSLKTEKSKDQTETLNSVGRIRILGKSSN